jgi:FMN reductase
MRQPVVLGISGSVSRPSRTAALVRHILERLEKRGGVQSRLIELADAAPVLFAELTPAKLSSAAKAIIDAVEDADLLVAATPVYRGSYTGAFKHLFDLVDHQAFTGKPVVLAATGGTHLHGLVTEHELRPLFGFLNALTLPTTIYAVETDFADHRLTDANVRARIERAVGEALDQLDFGSDLPSGAQAERMVIRA